MLTRSSNTSPRTFPRDTAEAGVRIHPTACVDARAGLGSAVDIGPYVIVEAGARIGDRTTVMAHAYICRNTTIGPDCEVHMGVVLGHQPQIRGLVGETGSLAIGASTILREHVTVHRASRPDGCTTIGSDGLLLGYSHVGHDCQIGDGVTIANGTLLAGFVTVGSSAFISGNVVVHQHVRLGHLTMIAGNARVAKDVPPFMMAVGESCVRGLNVVGMRRAGLPADVRQCIRRAFGLLYRSGLNVSEALARLRELPPSPEIDALVAFVEASRRGICRGPRTSRPRERRDEHQPAPRRCR